MTEANSPKRSYFVPVLLLLLVVSLTGNVILYTRTIVHTQDERAERGEAIMNAGYQTKQHIADVLHTIELLTNSKDIASRLEAKSRLADAFDDRPEVEYFFAEAEASNGKPLHGGARSPQDFLAGVEQALEKAGNHEGELTSGERDYLAMLGGVYAKLQETASDLIYDGEVPKRDEALTAQADKRWIEIAASLAAIMNEPEQLEFQS
ncbi:hypothetical protein [Paenibacillus xanthanilyticus]|uniref:Chemotaxis methyl-accepting receptor HlyB-like 4HB MCP domain-containing protein n=1 Tax=Paenibacillus xanthanilyticus TaxID=1783531 RepID=A0ABV8KD86_9BACL